MARRDVDRIDATEASAERLIQLAREGRQIVRLITHAVDPALVQALSEAAVAIEVVPVEPLRIVRERGIAFRAHAPQDRGHVTRDILVRLAPRIDQRGEGGGEASVPRVEPKRHSSPPRRRGTPPPAA